ncbi:hypothetical protein H0H81_011192 [Sphagnurus paluster]|uniref:EF-hand domain-containing protein n=1 Tax=Sphagnurus paluster TaxID=117069 RepID=A0A9P7FNY8_9AGAR|nr:hypothetical protein H0H81_011192 [Sphagnurus paluster]
MSSPPYEQSASTNNLQEPQDSPAYYPSPTVPGVSKEKEKKASVTDDESETLPDEFDTSKSRPTVHYIDQLNPDAAPAPAYTRSDSADITSRPSSIATDDEDSEDYDWSGEEDLADEEANFEERMGLRKTERKGWGFKRIITLLFSTIIGSTFLAGILVVPGVLVHIYWYNPNPTDHRRYVKDNVQAWLFWAASNLVISWYLAMIVDVIPVLVRFFISASWGHVSEHVKTRIEMYDSVKNNIKPVLYAASGWVSWVIIFGNIYDLYNAQKPDQSRAAYTQRLEDVVEFFFFFALVICVKRMLSHTIAFFFHRTAYKERVESAQEALKVVEALRQYRPKASARTKKSPGTWTPLFGSGGTQLSDNEHYRSLKSALRSATPRLRRQYDADDGADGDDEDGDRTLVDSAKRGRFSRKGKEKRKDKDRDRLSWLQSSGPNERTPPPTGPADLGEREGLPSFSEGTSVHRYPPSMPNVNETEGGGGGGEVPFVQAAKVLKNAVLHDARNIKGKNIGDGSMAWNISSTQEAKRLARAIYTQFKDRRRRYLLPSDFYPAFPSEADAEAAFRIFDKDNNGDISRGEIKTTLVRVYKERRFLSRSMRDVGAALKTLDYILLFFAMIVLFFISLSVFGVDVGSSLTSVYSIGIAASFIFKNSASSAFDAIIFLFVSHPYDTGDRCFIDDENLVVKKVGLFATVFTRSDGTETYYFNSQLFTKLITNKMFENVTMQVAWRTPLEKLDELQRLMNEWLSTEENRWFDPATSVSLQHIEFQRYLTITIGIGHNGNWQVRAKDWDLRLKRKTAFHAAVQYYCRQLDITYFESPIPVIYADPHKQRHTPLAAPSGTPQSPSSPTMDAGEQAMKPTLGFLPPASTRTTQLRARKSRSTKAGVRGLDAG